MGGVSGFYKNNLGMCVRQRYLYLSENWEFSDCYVADLWPKLL